MKGMDSFLVAILLTKHCIPEELRHFPKGTYSTYMLVENASIVPEVLHRHESTQAAHGHVAMYILACLGIQPCAF